MKWVPINPLVVAPQMAKPPARAQKVVVLAAARRAPTASGGTGRVWSRWVVDVEGRAVRTDTPIGRIVPEHEQYERHHCQCGQRDHERGGAPGNLLGQLGQDGQEDQL